MAFKSFLTTVIAGAAVVGVAFGNPVIVKKEIDPQSNLPSFPQPDGEQSCIAHDFASNPTSVDYQIGIGQSWKAFRNGGCGQLHEDLNAGAKADGDWSVSNWICEEMYDSDDQIYVEFRASTTGHSATINKILTATFTKINGFNCPDS
ncbi:hypothetical protein EJ03DRAFT_378865 [Teratosphaeria nubilosa]|uniref:Ecp2 effector protein domain-containing protein n=1 Tax=Teratosphaeria nubilosa TaxID=161662 RepID=A0A6G1KVC4_9PEZI|nr:hypothetical protein EJ03DRAFT_378865 [Teratosphaeria nubilosa]